MGGTLRGVEIIEVGVPRWRVAWAVSESRADLTPLFEEGLCGEPTPGGTVAWVALLTDLGFAEYAGEAA